MKTPALKAGVRLLAKAPCELELELKPERKLIRFGQRPNADRVSGKMAVTRIFDAQTERLAQIVAQADTIVDPVTLTSRVGGDQRSACKERRTVCLRVPQAAIQRHIAHEFPT